MPTESSAAAPDRKRDLRSGVLGRRDALDADWREQAGIAISARLAESVGARGARCVLSYSSFRSEWSSLHFNRHILESGRELYLPRVDRAIRRLAIHRVTDLAHLRPGTWQIPEPDPDLCPTLAALDRIDFVVVPGAAFDRSGGRLGYGGGFYDRLLVDLPNAFRAAATFSLQLVAEVPVEPHDQRVDQILTEDEAWSVQSGR